MVRSLAVDRIQAAIPRLQAQVAAALGLRNGAREDLDLGARPGRGGGVAAGPGSPDPGGHRTTSPFKTFHFK